MSQIADVCISRRLVPLDQASFIKQINPSFSDLEAQLFAARGVKNTERPSFPEVLLTPMSGLLDGAARLADAIQAKEPIVVVADYDCDGATACAVAVSGLRSLGAVATYVVPDRMVHGYGISPAVVDLAIDRYPNAKVLVTVDNGILGHSGISYAGTRGLDVVVTDHHLPGDTLPDALAVINPARDDCPSGLSKLAGCGVALWLVAAVKRALATRGVASLASLNYLLSYATIGTIADMVQFDAANRQLVALGLDRMRKGDVPAGIAALINEAGCALPYLTTQDVGFNVAPRINAAGRLDTMDAGIELLLTADTSRAKELAKLLTETNETRKQLQKEAVDDASFKLDFNFLPEMMSVVTGSSDWHPGIVGLVASKLKEKHNRPTFVFSLMDGVAKGSGRSIPGFHLKDALEEVARRVPNVLAKFGGHAMAAGATLTSPEALSQFERAFSDVAGERINEHMLNNVLLSDGPMPTFTLDSAAKVLRHPWGQGFEAPAFDDEAIIDEIRPLGAAGLHWRILARIGGRSEKTTVVLFNQPEPVLNQTVRLYLQPSLNTWKGTTMVQWLGRILH